MTADPLRNRAVGIPESAFAPLQPRAPRSAKPVPAREISVPPLPSDDDATIALVDSAARLRMPPESLRESMIRLGLARELFAEGGRLVLSVAVHRELAIRLNRVP